MILFGGIHLVFILHWNIYLAKRGEPERMLGGHIESSAKWRVISRTFQEVEVPSGRTF
jgi:hypothetical protein